MNNQPLTLEELQVRILDEIQLRQELATAYAEARARAAKADHMYRRAKAIAVTKIKLDERKEDRLTDLIREAMRDQQCEQERLQQRVTDAEVDGLYQRLQASGSAVSALQTLARLALGEMDMEKFGQRVGA